MSDDSTTDRKHPICPHCGHADGSKMTLVCKCDYCPCGSPY